MYSLMDAVESAKVGDLSKIAFPMPRLPEDYRNSVEPILVQGAKQPDLVTFDEMEGI